MVVVVCPSGGPGHWRPVGSSGPGQRSQSLAPPDGCRQGHTPIHGASAAAAVSPVVGHLAGGGGPGGNRAGGAAVRDTHDAAGAPWLAAGGGGRATGGDARRTHERADGTPGVRRGCGHDDSIGNVKMYT